MNIELLPPRTEARHKEQTCKRACCWPGVSHPGYRMCEGCGDIWTSGGELHDAFCCSLTCVKETVRGCITCGKATKYVTLLEPGNCAECEHDIVLKRRAAIDAFVAKR